MKPIAVVNLDCTPSLILGLEEWRRQRPFEGYADQPDTAERTRLAVQSIPFALPEKRDE